MLSIGFLVRGRCGGSLPGGAWELPCCDCVLVLAGKAFTPGTLSAYQCSLATELAQPRSDRNSEFLTLS